MPTRPDRVPSRRQFLTRAAVTALAAAAGSPMASLLVRSLDPGTGAGAHAAPRGDDLAGVRAGIQATLDAFAEARRSGNADRLKDVLDPGSGAAALRRNVTEQFQAWQQQAARGRLRPLTYTVTAVRPALAGLMKADLTATLPAFRELGPVTLEGTWVFRAVDGAWRLTEPTEAELGQRRLHQTDHFRIRYFEWDAGLIDRLGGLFEQAYALDTARAGFDAPEAIYATVSPTFGVNPSLTNRAYAFYAGGTLHVRSPESCAYGLSAPGDGDGAFLGTVQHEYGHHLMRVRTKGRAVKPWLDEGFADWLPDSFRRGSILVGFNDGLIPDHLLDWADARIFNEQTQPGHEVGIAYGLGANAVRYIVTERGGLDQFWALVDGYVSSRDWAGTIQALFNQSWPEFQTTYRAWLHAWATDGA